MLPLESIFVLNHRIRTVRKLSPKSNREKRRRRRRYFIYTCLSRETFTWETTPDAALARMFETIAEETWRFSLETPVSFSFLDPFMQPRGAPSTFGNLKEEPLRASWPAMLVDPSWYVRSSLAKTISMQESSSSSALVISTQPLVLLRLISKSNHRTICAKVTSSILPWLCTTEVANQSKSNEPHSWASWKRKW